MAAPMPAQGLVALDNTFGIMLVGTIVSAVLFGVLTVQTHYYYKRFGDDPSWIKWLVAVIWFLDLAHQLGASGVSYSYTVTHFADPTYLFRSTWVVSLTIALEPMTGLLVQLYFARRHWILNRKNWFLSGAIVLTAFVAFAAGEAAAIITFRLSDFSRYFHWTYLVALWLAASGVGDLLVTASVCWTLWHSKTGFQRTDTLVAKLIVWTINTGGLTSLVALADILTFITCRKALIHLALNYVLSKLYSNTLLASLNRRRKWSEKESNTYPSDSVVMSKFNHSTTVSGHARAIARMQHTASSSTSDGIMVAMTRADFTDTSPGSTIIIGRESYDRDGVSDAERSVMDHTDLYSLR